MPPQPQLVRQHALEYDSLEPPAPRTANEIEDERIWIEQQQRNTRNLHNVLSDMRPARNIDNVMSDRNRNGGKQGLEKIEEQELEETEEQELEKTEEQELEDEQIEVLDHKNLYVGFI